MRFGPVQQNRFGTSDGAYSSVTDTEYSDSQITLADSEKLLVERYFGPGNILRGNVGSSRSRAKKKFRLYPSGQNIELNLVYPKPNKEELRLYLSENAGFKPSTGDVWFVFCDGQDLWLGAEREAIWRLSARTDDEDERYQAAAEAIAAGSVQRAISMASRMQYTRNPILAAKRFELSSYECEADPTHELFISRASGYPFLEAHHLIPVSLQSNFKIKDLDVIENIYAICPMCHRAVHHAQCGSTVEIIERLLAKRSDALKLLDLSLDDLWKIYGCEIIT